MRYARRSRVQKKKQKYNFFRTKNYVLPISAVIWKVALQQTQLNRIIIRMIFVIFQNRITN